MSATLVRYTAALLQADADGATARDIINDHVRADGRVDPAFTDRYGWRTAHGFEWRMLQIDDKTGEQIPVRHDQVFETGTPFKIQIEAYTDLYVYVINLNKDGTLASLFPEKHEGHHLIPAWQAVKIPPDPEGGRKDRFRFVPPAGRERFFIIASADKLNWAEPAKLLERGGNSQGQKAIRDWRRDGARVLSGKSIAKLLRSARLDESGEKNIRAPRSKNIVLVGPPGDGGQEVLCGSEQAGYDGPFVLEVLLVHSP
jgi:hypothetical protein